MAPAVGGVVECDVEAVEAAAGQLPKGRRLQPDDGVGMGRLGELALGVAGHGLGDSPAEKGVRHDEKPRQDEEGDPPEKAPW